YQRKKIVKRNGGEIYVASIGDLIKLKELAGRDIDLFDLKKLRKLKEQEDDK
ncbi:hypothetical protein HZB00_00865, partial [Candidatus Woesearchaeota archaeon]|nr:hypothetical protein [Candidatus Woesearchaeota archaeon]